MSSLSLEDATVQEIQLELISRAGYPEVVDTLREHPDLWEAALITRMTGMQLITLRDLPGNHWNTDELFILCSDQQAADTIVQLADLWSPDTAWILSVEEAIQRLGSTMVRDKRVVACWWD